MRDVLRTVFVTGLPLLLIATPVSYAHADAVFRISQNVAVDAEQMLQGDFYALGNSITISGNATEDVYIAGGTVTINGDIGKDLTVVGGVVQVHGSVGDDVRIFGGEVTIAEPVGGDIAVLSGILTLLSTASVKGDVLFAGSNVNLEGSIAGSVVGTGEGVRINATVEENVSVRATNSFSLGDKASIKGDVHYTSPTGVIRAQNAVVEGSLSRKSESTSTSGEFGGRALAVQFLVLLFASITLFLVARRQLEILAHRTFSEYGKQGLVGLGLLIIVPAVAVLLITSILGMFVGLFLLFLYVALIVLSWATASIVLGMLIMRSLKSGETLTLAGVIMGALALTVVSYIPVLGPLFLALLFLAVLGGYGLMLYRSVE